MGLPTIGTVLLFAGNKLTSEQQKYWMFCRGQELPVASFTQLYSVIGTTYGGTVNVNFNLPDLRGRVAIGTEKATSNALGQKGGDEEVTLTVDQLPSHSHVVMNQPADQYMRLSSAALELEETAVPQEGDGPGLGVFVASGFNRSVNIYVDKNTPNKIKGQALTAYKTTAILNSGGGKPHTNMQPYLVMNYIIAYNGTYPIRN